MTDEERLQDYIDGRMNPSERNAFESEMARNPEFAAAASFAREIGQHLRGGTTELPPGFHARARARFEASRKRLFRLPRRFPWEAVGLAAAAVVVLVLLFPWTRTGRPGSPTESPLGSPVETKKSQRRNLSDEPIALPAPAIRTERDSVQAPDAALPEFAPTPAGGKATADPSSREPRAPSDELRGLPQKSAGIVVRDDRTQHAARVDESLSKSEALQGVRAAEIPLGLIRPGTTKIIESAADELWIRLTTGGSGSEVRALQPRFENERVFVFGPRDFSVSCREVRWMPQPDALLVLAGPATPTNSATSGGCALVIPRGNLPVVLDVRRKN